MCCRLTGGRERLSIRSFVPRDDRLDLLAYLKRRLPGVPLILGDLQRGDMKREIPLLESIAGEFMLLNL
jgi:hypothetical protein